MYQKSNPRALGFHWIPTAVTLQSQPERTIVPIYSSTHSTGLLGASTNFGSFGTITGRSGITLQPTCGIHSASGESTVGRSPCAEE